MTNTAGLPNDLIRLEDVQIVAQKFTKNDSITILHYTLTPFSEDTLGFLGTHSLLTVNFQKYGSDKIEAVSFFVKTLLQTPFVEFMNEKGIFIEELIFFQKIKPRLLEKYQDEDWSPTCYLTKDSCLIMENLGLNNFITRGHFFDETLLLKSALASVARFHACSILMEARLSQSIKKHVTLNTHFPDSFKEKLFNDDEYSKRWVTNRVNLAVAIAKLLKLDFPKLNDIHKKLVDIIKPSELHRNVICHNDLWTNNLMFDDSKPMPRCILVDFQNLRYAPLVLDVLELLYMNTTLNYRKRYESELIEFYQTVLDTSVKNNDETKTAKVPRIEEIKNGYEDFKLFGVALAVFYWPVILMDPDTLKKNYGGQNGFYRIMYEDTTNIMVDYMQKNRIYKIRMEEIVTEFVTVVENI